MTLPPVIRIFFAIDLPQETKREVGRFIGTLKKKSKTNAIRWTKPENLHVTLQFLAEVHSEHLHLLMENVRTNMVGKLKSQALSMGKLHLFPNPYRPRVIVLELDHQEELAALSALIGHGIKATNYEVESRPFRGHLTLGRIKHAQSVNLNFLAEMDQPEITPVTVSEVVLFRSEPEQHGSKYTVMETIALKGG